MVKKFFILTFMFQSYICMYIYISCDVVYAATVFGQNLRLEPLKPEKRAMWKREMDCLLSVCDYIVEFIPTTSLNLQEGTAMEVKKTNFKD